MGAANLDLVRRLVTADHGLAIVATTRPNGTVHTSLVNAGVLDDERFGEPTVAFVVRGDAKKLQFFRDAGRGNVVFRSGWEWVSVEGRIEIAGPDDTGPDDTGPDDTAVVRAADIPRLLRDIFVAAGGSHDNWDEYDRVMAAEHRTAVLVHPDSIVSN
jgi:Pyridoxamine 5'-phosphate oxidase